MPTNPIHKSNLYHIIIVRPDNTPIGLVLLYHKWGGIIVDQILAGSHAAQSSIQLGDELYTVNNLLVRGNETRAISKLQMNINLDLVVRRR